MTSNIELKYNTYGALRIDHHIHFNMLSEVDAYLSKQPIEAFTTNGYFSIARCRIGEEDSITAIIDMYDARASAVKSIRDNIAATTKLFNVSKDWIEFYEAVKAGDSAIVEQYAKHTQIVRELSAQIDELQNSCNAITSLIDE